MYFILFLLSFSMKKATMMLNKTDIPVIFLSGVIRSIIIQKNTLCTNKTCVIYFCPNCVNLLTENVHFLFFIFFFWGGGDCPPCLPFSSCAYDHNTLFLKIYEVYEKPLSWHETQAKLVTLQGSLESHFTQHLLLLYQIRPLGAIGTPILSEC